MKQVAIPKRSIINITAANIIIGARLRSHIDPERVQALADSIQKLGLRTPITIRTVAKMEIDGAMEEDVPVLVAGAHRLAALKLLGIEDAPCIDIGDDALAAELWEIAENLHRAELTALERDEHIARWIDLAEQQKVAQIAPPGGKQPKEAGVRAATKELGLDRRDVQRARTNASLTPEAKEAAKEVGLDDNRTALLEAAKVEPGQQAAVIRSYAEKRQADRSKLDGDLAPRRRGGVTPTDQQIAATEFAAWLAERATADDVRTITSWLLLVTPTEVISALKQRVPR